RDVALGPPDLDQVAKPRGGDHRHPRPAPLEYRVGPHRGPVHHPPHLGTPDAERGQPGQHRPRLLARPRRNLGDDDSPARLVDRGEIRERPAHIDPDQEHGGDDIKGGKSIRSMQPIVGRWWTPWARGGRWGRSPPRGTVASARLRSATPLSRGPPRAPEPV